MSVKQVEIIRNPIMQETTSPYEQAMRVWGGIYSFDELRRPLEASAYYPLLTGMQPRYSRFFWDDIEHFKQKMGSDVVPEVHGPYQARTIAIPMLAAQIAANQTVWQLPEELHDSFIAHHIQHDDHEGQWARQVNMKHDVSFTDKTTDIEAAEFELWCKIHLELFGAAAQAEIAKVAELGKTKMWLISERIGYFATALQAVFVARNDVELSPAERAKAWSMAVQVGVVNRNAVLEAARQHFPFVDDTLLATTDVVRELRLRPTA